MSFPAKWPLLTNLSIFLICSGSNSALGRPHQGLKESNESQSMWWYDRKGSSATWLLCVRSNWFKIKTLACTIVSRPALLPKQLQRRLLGLLSTALTSSPTPATTLLNCRPHLRRASSQEHSLTRFSKPAAEKELA